MRAILLLILLATALPDPAFAQAAECADLTALQRWAGYLSWLGVLKVAFISLVSAGFVIFFWGFIKWAAETMRYVLEIVAYGATIGFIGGGTLTGQEYSLLPVFFGCILFAASVLYTIWLHDIKGDDPRKLFMLFMVVWGAVAIYYNESVIGGLSVMALMGIVGFSFVVGPNSYSFGFTDDEVGSATTTAIVMLIAYMAVFLFWKDAPTVVKVFMPGALWLGSFVGFIGILILSNWYYQRHSGAYWPMQIVAIVVYGVAGSLGLIFDVVPLPAMAYAFFGFYFASKSIEFTMRSAMAVGFSLMLCGGILGATWYFATTNPAIAKHFMSLVG